MGKAAWLILLLLVPFPAAPPTAQPAQHDNLGTTWVLDLGEDVWTVADWTELVDQGHQPLRHLSPHLLLMWTEGAKPADIGGIGVEQAPPVQWRSGLDEPSIAEHSALRIVLEPYLPVNVKLAIGELLSIHGHLLGEGLETQHPLASIVTLELRDPVVLADFQLPGVAWVEPVLSTTARNGLSASLSEHGSMDEHPFWNMGLDGTGVVLGVADSGLDADHACFRNATDSDALHADAGAEHPALGHVGPEHRKILIINTTIDGNDTPGHTDYRHGTHVAGTLVCRDVQSERNEEEPTNGSALAHGATLVFQDIVNEDGWSPPPVDELLVEASRAGAIVHSNSWGDDTTAYTARTGLFDAYAVAVPWSLAFVAPGNAGEGILEPANGRNVVAVSATSKSLDPQRWSGTAYGPTEAGTDGVFLLAPGKSIRSAAADGFLNTNNNNLRSSSGTSMATPLAAGGAGVIQQMYEQGWIMGTRESTTEQSARTFAPSWSNIDDITVRLGQGFTPSGALLRATLALATTPLSEEHRNGGDGGDEWRTPYDGWGVLNLSQVFNPADLQHNTTASPNLWIHDSFRLNGSHDEWVAAHLANASNVTSIASTPWYGEDATGPFLQTGDRWERRFTPVGGEDVRIRMAFPAKPEPMMVDDLQLKVRLDDGRVLLGDRSQSNGTPTVFSSTINTGNFDLFPSTNETTIGLNIPASMLHNATHFDVEVVARFVAHGDLTGAVGLGGDATGFALVVQGVDRDSNDHGDDDLDGVANIDDLCPDEQAIIDDEDGDGCLDDDDQDGIPNVADDCPDRSAIGFDVDNNGCLDDSDGDGVTDEGDACVTPDLNWPVDSTGCYPVDRAAVVSNIMAPRNDSVIESVLNIGWAVVDQDGDSVSIEVQIRTHKGAQTNLTSYSSVVNATSTPTNGSCRWLIPDDLPPYTQHDQTYDVVIVVRSLNASPAAVRLPAETVIATNLTLNHVEDEPVPLPTSSGNAGLSMVLLTLVAMGAGILTVRFVARGKKEPSNENVKPPFAVHRANDQQN